MQVHANAPWTPRRRRELISQVDRGELTVDDAADLGGVSTRTIWRWLARWRAGDRALLDRSSRPHSCPHATPPALETLVVQLRQQRWTVVQLGDHLRLPYSTVSAICRRHGLGRLPRLEPVEPPNRYQRKTPGELLHLDIKKLGRIGRPGHRVNNDRTTRTRGIGWEYLHVAVDDATRLAYAEVLAGGETADATAAFLRRAIAWFAARGVTVQRVMTDNGSGYKSHRFAAVCLQHQIKHLRTKPYRPRTNGKAERFIRIIVEGWAYAITFQSSAARTRALPAWLHYYNHHRPHGSLNRETPGRRLHRLNNLAGKYT